MKVYEILIISYLLITFFILVFYSCKAKETINKMKTDLCDKKKYLKKISSIEKNLSNNKDEVNLYNEHARKNQEIKYLKKEKESLEKELLSYIYKKGGNK